MISVYKLEEFSGQPVTSESGASILKRFRLLVKSILSICVHLIQLADPIERYKRFGDLMMTLVSITFYCFVMTV